MKKFLFPLICIMSIDMANAQIVNIPDAIFKARLVNNAAINTNGDGEIQVSEAAAYNGFMNVSTAIGPDIMDLTGIEAFTALIGLDCSKNGLGSLDVSSNTALTHLTCYTNLLTSLNVSANTALTELRCWSNQLTSLDVSANTALNVLDCSLNPLTTSLNVSANTALTELFCAHNQLTSLDVSANTALTVLACGSNQLTSLNVQNGNNSNFTYFDAISNPNLTCIQVDNVAYSNANWTFIDATASFSTNCGALSVPTIGNLATLQIIPNPANSYVTVNGLNNIQKIELITMQGQIIKTNLVNGNSSLIDVSSITNGIYQLKLSSSNQSKTERLVVVH